MLLEGKAALALATLLGAVVIAAFSALPSVMQDVVVAGAAITAARYIWGSVISPMLRVGREVHAATTSELPERMERVEATQQVTNERLERGEVRFAAIEASIGAWADVERAAMSGVIEAERRPRPPRPSRSTDPDPSDERTGWRE